MHEEKRWLQYPTNQIFYHKWFDGFAHSVIYIYLSLFFFNLTLISSFFVTVTLETTCGYLYNTNEALIMWKNFNRGNDSNVLGYTFEHVAWETVWSTIIVALVCSSHCSCILFFIFSQKDHHAWLRGWYRYGTTCLVGVHFNWVLKHAWKNYLQNIILIQKWWICNENAFF